MGSASSTALRLGSMWEACQAFGRQRGTVLIAWTLTAILAAGSFAWFMSHVYLGDAYGYWQAARFSSLYHTAVGNAAEGYLYSPAFIQVMWPALALPWDVYHAGWTILLIAVFVFMARPWLACLLLAGTFLAFGFPPLLVVRHYLSSGNIFLLMSLAVAAGFRWPATWSFLLLTKVTPGIGLLWFAVRREWRNLAIALGATLGVVAASFVLAPGLWFDWVAVLRNNAGYPEPSFAVHIAPLLPRLGGAALITIVGARLNARWVVPIAATMALPYIPDTGFIMLLGAVPLLRNDEWTRRRPIQSRDSSERALESAAGPQSA